MEYRISRTELISKFKNGEERYLNSALFKNTIEYLLRGSDPLDLIDQLISMIEDTKKDFLEYATNNPVRFIKVDKLKVPQNEH